MKSAINNLVVFTGQQWSLSVAGDMLELGEQAESLHRQVGAWAAAAGINQLWVTGDFAGAVIAGAKDAGMKVEHIFTGSREDVLIELQKSLKPGDWVLVKGSRGARMDAVVEGLKQWAGVETGTER